MPADGTSALPSVPATEGNGRPAAHPLRAHRARFRRFQLIAYAVTAALHVTPVVAMAPFTGSLVAIGLGAVLFAATALVLRSVVRERRRARFRTALIDLPLLVHWCASLLATLLFPMAALLALLGVALLGAGTPPSRSIELAAGFAYVFSFGVASWGFTFRRRFVRVSHVDVPVEGLAREFDGYRIAQISDLHIGNFDSKERGKQWAREVNALSPDLVAVTGDLVTTGTAFYEDLAQVLGDLSAPDGIYVSMGNHDQWDPDALASLISARGPVVLRNEWRVVARREGALVVAGIDDRMTGKDDLARTLEGRPSGVPTVLLSHYPDFFEEAAGRGVELVLSGHTHGGQIAVPFAARRLSLSRLVRQPAAGLHIRGKSRLYVNAGLGTTGPPVRLGVPPEIAVLTLRRA